MAAPGTGAAPSGVVFDIQRFSLHDGPGIRTTVFLKGCPLRCVWCANPESQSPSPILLVREVNCRRCGACVSICPEGAIHMAEDAPRQIDWDLCTHCLECVDSCIYESLNACGREMTVTEVMAEVLRDEVFYETSRGGVTMSGGEALSQGEFLHGLLQQSKDAGLHTALDTSGLAPWRVLERVLPLVDLLLYDVKHLDSRAHLEMTGVRNEAILENLRKTAGRTRIWLRVPLIAGFNDSEEHICGLIDLAKEVEAEKISLLPYHLGGQSKCAQIGTVYGFDEGRAPEPERVAKLKELIEGSGVAASVSS